MTSRPDSRPSATRADCSDSNEQNVVTVEGDGTSVTFKQIAGLIARRILTFIHEGDPVEAGQRIGLIRFGSRVDVYLPLGTGPKVLLGQRAIAGETVLAEIGVETAISGRSQ